MTAVDEMQTSTETHRSQLAIIRRAPWGGFALAVLLLVYGCLLWSGCAPAISEPDANGYWAQGTLLVDTGQTWFKPESAAQYIGLHWLLTPDGNFISRYPPGLPLLIGLVDAIFGYKAAVMVNPALALIAVAGIYLAAKRIAGTGLALLAAGLLAFNPTFTQHALSNDSHIAVAACIAWGFYFLIAWSQQSRLWQIFLAGLILGCIPTVRYPDAIIAGAVGLFILMHFRKHRFPLHLLAALAGAAVPIVPLLVRNQMLLGAFWKTGYALTNEQTGFGWEYFKEKWADYIYNMNADAMGLIFATGLLSMVVMLAYRRTRSLGVLLGGSAVPMILLYMAYYWGPQSAGTMRFIVPTIPCFVLGTIWLLNELTMATPTAARIAVPLALATVQLGWGVPQILNNTGRNQYQKQVLAQVTDALDDVAPEKGDVVVAQTQLLQHLDFVRHWKLADPSLVMAHGGQGRAGLFGGVGPAAPGPGRGGRGGRGGIGFPFGPGGGDPESPQPMQLEKNDFLRSLYPGAQGPRKFVRDVFAWANGMKVFVVGPEEEVRQSALSLAPNSSITVVKRVPLPEQPPEPLRMGRGGRGGQGGAGRGGRGGRGGGFIQAFAGSSEVVIAEWKLPTTR
jgi:4-amino-4-deoxy-L-arabinose transferase-like glycosyltransferase